ncbi:Blp family class II bacteriocin [Listeria cossartiae]|uniref:Blp family class II bacteriocin n=1 Tax=Listeria cossartiae TaxID=2838249 RepID=UPI0016245FB1|nr:Blp family class II bacteriocin [Listeria cossartiae]MBC1543120.1 bacteriocin [Listeria cossartiae subsp. cossartiae]MBC1548290.1 bacteriocin [Listeria cossartiae subsp. cossartiae]MBC1550152.1 bacteriocin [Listeria cossartiae subsp. cossartiae]MBC1567878.1 bacteriocin [Listeria cossartiae subsp. cossartiae]MBC1571033.1 bacteriocin [Listeria cossartiae subsp. cossartiae]
MDEKGYKVLNESELSEVEGGLVVALGTLVALGALGVASFGAGFVWGNSRR